MKTLADVVADHVSSVLSSVDSAARVMGVRAYPDAHDRQIYLSAASDVLTATALALGLSAEFGPALPPAAPSSLPAPQVLDTLTKSERRIAEMIVDGMTTVKIAEKLVVEPCTVKAHRRNLAVKIGGSEREFLLQFPQLKVKVEAAAAP